MLGKKSLYSIGLSWPGDVLRRLVGARGAWQPPDSYQGQLYPVAEIRPQNPWEYKQAGWVRGAVTIDSPIVAGQFSTVDITNPASSSRFAIVGPWELFAAGGAVNLRLYVNRPLINPTKGAGTTDSRNRSSAGSWLTPLTTGMAAGSLAALPVAADSIWLTGAAVQRPSFPIIVLEPGQTVTVAAQVAAQNFSLSCEVLEIPLEDVLG